MVSTVTRFASEARRRLRVSPPFCALADSNQLSRPAGVAYFLPASLRSSMMCA